MIPHIKFLLSIVQIVVLGAGSVACGSVAPGETANTPSDETAIVATLAAPYPDSRPESSTAQPLAAGPTVFADGPAPVLGIVIDANGVVLHVEPSGMAAQAQLQPGDVLLSVNGFAPIADRQAVKAAITQTTATSPLMLRISRNGKEQEIAAVPPLPSSAPMSPPVATATPVLPPNDYL